LVDGKQSTLNCDNDVTVENLKLMIQDKHGIPSNLQILRGGSGQLNDGHLLSNYGIRNESTISLQLRMKGD